MYPKNLLKIQGVIVTILKTKVNHLLAGILNVMTSLSGFNDILIAIVSILISLVIHEFMHGYVAHLLGDTTADEAGRLSLNPMRHIDPFMTILLPIITIVLFHFPILAAKPVPFNPARLKYDEFGAAMVAAAGPLSNLVLAVIGGVLVQHVLAGGSGLSHALVIFTQLNVALFVFNLIPIPPLDGSRVLYAFSPEPFQRFLASIEPYGFFIVFGLVLYGGIGSILNNVIQSVLNILP